MVDILQALDEEPPRYRFSCYYGLLRGERVRWSSVPSGMGIRPALAVSKLLRWLGIANADVKQGEPNQPDGHGGVFVRQ